ncbi:uncharacterized protein LOC116111328 isoform X1 [Pistacia vera]|uniref:uncharacterized protein LOC116111328 isoform X1 n=1 Tax=Pistacia vera TaxID=55513 RepID=UPI0012635303|nr:uncharacterized protein LOC116111328 isoform X1 [Pistacia vera]
MIVLRLPTFGCPLHPPSAKFCRDFDKSLSPLLFSPNTALSYSIFNFKLSSKASLKCCCIKNEIKEQPIKGFSVLASDIPWESESLWSTMAMYMFNLHIPLGYGGMSVAAYVLNQPVLEPQTQALSLLVFQILELSGALFLLSRTIKPQHDLLTLFKAKKLSEERNWLLASALGLGFLILLVFSTLLIADRLFGAKAASNSIMKEILLSSNISKTASVLVNCIIAPLTEEAVYRGFLLTSLAATLNWQKAVVISSAIFSAAHFSVDNFLQLFIIGCVLGCSYCWSGNLRSSIVIHSLYNALILLMTILS